MKEVTKKEGEEAEKQKVGKQKVDRQSITRWIKRELWGSRLGSIEGNWQWSRTRDRESDKWITVRLARRIILRFQNVGRCI